MSLRPSVGCDQFFHELIEKLVELPVVYLVVFVHKLHASCDLLDCLSLFLTVGTQQLVKVLFLRGYIDSSNRASRIDFLTRDRELVFQAKPSGLHHLSEGRAVRSLVISHLRECCLDLLCVLKCVEAFASVVVLLK